MRSRLAAATFDGLPVGGLTENSGEERYANQRLAKGKKEEQNGQDHSYPEGRQTE
jgi:hypothetical protein